MYVNRFFFFFSTLQQQELFRVVNNGYGEIYKRVPPKSAADHWLGTATMIGRAGWTHFRHLFFHPDGTLYGVWDDKFYKAPPLPSASHNWIDGATRIGNGGWNAFQFLFFDPEGVLYGVRGGKLCKQAPPSHSHDTEWS